MVVVQHGHTLTVEHRTQILSILFFGLQDYAWAIEHLQRGHKCKRLPLRFGYDRSCEFAKLVFQFARRYKLCVTWLCVLPSMQQMLTALFMRRPDMPPPALNCGRLKAWAAMRFTAASSFSGQ
jgi:hypothetical protein